MSIATQSRFDRRFQLFDQDGNGVIDRTDFKLIADRICTGLKIPPGEEQDRNVHKAYAGLWQRLCATAGVAQDAALDHDRFAAAMSDLTASAGAFDAAIRPAVLAVLDAADSDGDGQLDRQEAIRLVRAMGVPSTRAADAVTRLDLDGDGMLSVDELLAAYKNHAMSHQSEPEGSMLFGAASAS